MTFQKIKEVVVEEKGLMTQKELGKFSIQLALFILGLCSSLSFATYAILGFAVTVIVIFLSILGYTWIFDLVTESEKAFKAVNKMAKFWWFTYIILVGVFLVLKLTRFI